MKRRKGYSEVSRFRGGMLRRFWPRTRLSNNGARVVGVLLFINTERYGFPREYVLVFLWTCQKSLACKSTDLARAFIRVESAKNENRVVHAPQHTRAAAVSPPPKCTFVLLLLLVLFLCDCIPVICSLARDINRRQSLWLLRQTKSKKQHGRRKPWKWRQVEFSFVPKKTTRVSDWLVRGGSLASVRAKDACALAASRAQLREAKCCTGRN